MDGEVINNFAQWANKVKHVLNSKPKHERPASSQAVTIASLKDLDDMMTCDPRLAPLPMNTKKLRRAMHETPDDIEREHDEILCFLDTSSNVHAADAEVHFPKYVSHVKKSSSGSSSRSAITAVGHKLQNLGKITVHDEAGGKQIKVHEGQVSHCVCS